LGLVLPRYTALIRPKVGSVETSAMRLMACGCAGSTARVHRMASWLLASPAATPVNWTLGVSRSSRISQASLRRARERLAPGRDFTQLCQVRTRNETVIANSFANLVACPHPGYKVPVNRPRGGKDSRIRFLQFG